MSTRRTFDEVLDAIEHLPMDQQVDLIEVVRRRLVERGRQRVAGDVADARAAHAAEETQVSSVDSLVREIES